MQLSQQEGELAAFLLAEYPGIQALPSLERKAQGLQLCGEHLKSKEDAQAGREALGLDLCALPWWVEFYFKFHFCSQAERIFSEVRRIENYRVEGMEIYSTTLWHLQKDVALSVLSKDLTDMDKNSPEV